MTLDKTFELRPTTSITCKANVRMFFDELLALGINFHPDTPAADYTIALPRRYDANMARCFDIGKRDKFDVYAVAVDAFVNHAFGNGNIEPR